MAEIELSILSRQCPCNSQDFILQLDQQNLFVYEQAIPQTTLFGFDPTRKVNLILPSNSILCVAQIQRHAFDLWAALMQRRDLNDRWLRTNFVTVPNMINQVQTYLKKLYAAALSHPEDFTQASSRPRLENFIPLLIDAIPHASNRLNLSLRSPRRFELVKQAEEYMRAHLEASISLMSLCQALYTSERPLSWPAITLKPSQGLTIYRYPFTQSLEGREQIGEGYSNPAVGLYRQAGGRLQVQ